jgi:hypothetical protein
MNDFKTGVFDATADSEAGWLPKNFTLDFLVNQLRTTVGASDYYIAGYVSAVYGGSYVE